MRHERNDVMKSFSVGVNVEFLSDREMCRIKVRFGVTWGRLKVSRRLFDIGSWSLAIVDRLIVGIVNILNRS